MTTDQQHVTNGRRSHTGRSHSGYHSHLTPVESDEPYDLIGVGFGPANLALAIALHDALDKRLPLPGLAGKCPKVLFLERQSHYGWHEGMLLPHTKMQISFVKDLATLRDPKSNFTFLNYLHSQNRLVQFTNLDTFQPSRIEYHDYMEWCASHFDNVVAYGNEALHVTPHFRNRVVAEFHVGARDVASGRSRNLRARHVVIAIGGGPSIPAPLPAHDPRVIHSSQYAKVIENTLPDPSAAYNVAVIGAGQSAAEIFNDLHSRYPNARTKLLFRGAALRPSDDSPFVNDIFDPDRVDEFYRRPPAERQASLLEDKSTNYGVVRIGLLETLYHKLYDQRIRESNPSLWQHQIHNHTTVVDAKSETDGMELTMKSLYDRNGKTTFQADAVIVAAGYSRDAHEKMLKPCHDIMPKASQESGKCNVGRNYQVELQKDAVAPGVGIWLQGCNETTHGLSDTLLSILAPRGGEMVQSLFGNGVLEQRARL